MSVFAQPGLFLRDPRGGVEGIDAMAAAGFRWVACNCGDHVATAWEQTIRPRALALGVACMPWARTAQGDNEWSPSKLELLVYIAGRWGSPLIVNTESEAKGSGSEITGQIAAATAGFDAAVSMEWWPFDDVDWTPLGAAGIPVLPQLFPEADATNAILARDVWQNYGVHCVYPTFASYGGRRPSDYDLAAPYSVYTADDMGQNYAAWAPTSSGYVGCVEQPVTPPKPPTNGATMTKGAATSADLAFDHWHDSSAKPSDWRRDNPKEWAAIQEYREAPAGTAPPTGIQSHTGQMLLEMIEARRWADGSHA